MGARDKDRIEAQTALPNPDAHHELARAYEQHRDYVRRCLRKAGLGGDALDDAVHDVFAVLVRRLADYKPDSTMRQWLAGISRHVAWAHHRRARRSVGELPNVEPAVRPPVELRIDLSRSLADLDEPQRTAVLLADGNGLSAQEIATAQGVPLTTAQWRIRSARARLRSTLERMASGLALLDPRAWLRPLVLSSGTAGALITVALVVAPPEPGTPADVVTAAASRLDASAAPAAARRSDAGAPATEIPRIHDDRLTAHVRIGEPQFASVAPRIQEPPRPTQPRKPARARPRPRTRPAESGVSPLDVAPPAATTDASTIDGGPIAIDAHRVRSGRPPVF